MILTVPNGGNSYSRWHSTDYSLGRGHKVLESGCVSAPSRQWGGGITGDSHTIRGVPGVILVHMGRSVMPTGMGELFSAWQFDDLFDDLFTG